MAFSQRLRGFPLTGEAPLWMGLQAGDDPLSLPATHGSPMRNPDQTIDEPQAPAGAEDAIAEDGWRKSASPPADLSALRMELDRLDTAIHDLLINRASVVEQVARSGKPAAFRPGREASIVRRLIGRHRGTLPKVTIFRLWRELLAGTTSMQGGFSIAVCDPEPGALFTQLAREHFGAMTPSQKCASSAQALAEVAQGRASIAVLPFPSKTQVWWATLRHHEPRLHVIGRLPFWRSRTEGTPSVQALVVASTPPDASGDDHTLLSFECDGEINRTRLAAALTDAGLPPGSILLVRDPHGGTAQVLIEVPGLVDDDDARLRRLDPLLRRPMIVGGYAVPFPEGM